EADDLRRRRVRRQAQADPQGTVPDRNGSGGAVAGFNRSDRAALPEGRRRSSVLSADGDAARASVAELVRLQRPGDGGSAVRDDDPAPVRWAEPGTYPRRNHLLNFRRLLERHELAAGILAVINGYLGDRGLSLRQGTVVDATLIHAPSSTKNKDGKRDP